MSNVPAESALNCEEAKTLENSLTYLLMNKEFNSQSPREKAKLLTQKVLSI